MINKIILVGNIWKPVLKRTTIKGDSVSTIYLVTKEYILDKNATNNDTNKVYKELKEWHTIVVFGLIADYVGNHFNVGDLIYVEGQLKTREILSEDKEKKNYIKEIVINKDGKVKKLYGKKRESEDENNSNNSELNMDIDDDIVNNEEDEMLF